MNKDVVAKVKFLNAIVIKLFFSSVVDIINLPVPVSSP